MRKLVVIVVALVAGAVLALGVSCGCEDGGGTGGCSVGGSDAATK